MFLKYQSRAEEISGTFRWIESKGGASYDVCANAEMPALKKTRNHEAHEKNEGPENPFGGS